MLIKIYNLSYFNICVYIFLFLGPSNSQKNIDCHVPSTSFLFSIRTVWDKPKILDFI